MKTYEELLAERDALAAENETLTKLISEKASVHVSMNVAEIKAEAVTEFAKEYGGKFSGLPDFASSAVSLFADQYAAKIRNAGTWLKDSNVNGGKRQGGTE